MRGNQGICIVTLRCRYMDNKREISFFANVTVRTRKRYENPKVASMISFLFLIVYYLKDAYKNLYFCSLLVDTFSTFNAAEVF